MRFNSIFALTALLSSLVFGASSSATAQDVPSENLGNTLVNVEALPSVRVVHPGERFLLAFRFTMQPEWHIYYENPGETGSPTTIDIKAPEGFKVGRIMWPRPQIIAGDFTTYGYEDETTLFVPVKAPEQLTDGTATFSASINWLVCKQLCYLGSATREVVVTTTTAALPDAGPTTALDVDDHADETTDDNNENGGDRVARGKRFEIPEVEKAFLHLPRNLNRNKRATITFDDSRVVITGPALRQSTVAFVPNNTPGVTTNVVEQRVNADDNMFRIVMDVKVDRGNLQGRRPVVAGMVNLGAGPDDPAFTVRIPLNGRQPEERDSNRTNGSGDDKDAGA